MGKPTVIDLFCGVGGISRGFQNAGFDVLLGIDTNKHALSIFQKQFPSSNVVNKDLKNVTAGEIRRVVGDRQIDAVVGGPPCQGFSIANKVRRGNHSKEERNNLFYEFVRIAKALKPKWVLMENVMGLRSAVMPDGKKALDAVIDAFSPEYDMKPFYVDSSEYSVPQKRRRIIFVNQIEGVKFDIIPKRIRIKPVKSVLIEKSKIPKKYFYSEKLIHGFERRERKNKENDLGFRWQFLNPEKPSYTIPARYWKDGSNALVRYSQSEIRMLTEKECAKIQCLNPKHFKGGREDYIAIGNAVPWKIITPFAKTIKSSFEQSNNK